MKSTTKGSKKSTPVAKMKSTTKSSKPGMKKGQKTTPWEVRFDELSQFHAKHGHYKVPQNQNAALYKWFYEQRRLGRNGKLLQVRKQKLESLGVDTTKSSKPSQNKGQQVPWEVRFDELTRLKAEHGHRKVPKIQHAALYGWYVEQRRLGRNGNLEKKKKERIESLDVDWFPAQRKVAKKFITQKWKQKFEELKQYKAEHGTCEIQVGASQDKAKAKSLRQWVFHQRNANNGGKLTRDQQQQLESINFTWKGRGRWGHSGSTPRGVVQQDPNFDTIRDLQDPSHLPRHSCGETYSFIESAGADSSAGGDMAAPAHMAATSAAAAFLPVPKADDSLGRPPSSISFKRFDEEGHSSVVQQDPNFDTIRDLQDHGRLPRHSCGESYSFIESAGADSSAGGDMAQVTNANLLGGEPPSSISFHPKARDEDVQSLGDASVPRQTPRIKKKKTAEV